MCQIEWPWRQHNWKFTILLCYVLYWSTINRLSASTHHHDSLFDRRHASPSENITRVPFSSTHHHDSHSYQKISREFHFHLLIIMIAIPFNVRPPKNITRVPFSSTHHHDSLFDRCHASPSENITRVPFSSTHHHDSHSYQRQAPEKYQPFWSTPRLPLRKYHESSIFINSSSW